MKLILPYSPLFSVPSVLIIDRQRLASAFQPCSFTTVPVQQFLLLCVKNHSQIVYRDSVMNGCHSLRLLSALSGSAVILSFPLASQPHNLTASQLHGRPAEHAGEFSQSGLLVQHSDVGQGTAIDLILEDLQMVLGLTGHLGEVGDAEQLMLFADLA
jgi:hypothetical protein